MRLLAVTASAAGLLVVVACSAPYGDGGTTEQASTTGKPVRVTDPTDPAPTPTPTPPPKSTPLPGNDGGTIDNGGAGGADASASDPTLCPSTASPTLTPWRAPPAVSSVCSSADMTYFASVAANQTWLGIESLMRTRNANCAKCIFSKETDASWHPVVYVGTAGDAVVNSAACFARTAGGSDACGRGVHEWGDCYAKVCDGVACGTDAASAACYQTKTASDLCGGYNPSTTCGGPTKYASLNNVCGTYIEVARALCAAGQ